MPGRFLSEAERDRLARFPASVPDEDLPTYFTLGLPDFQQIQAHRQPWNRLGFALQLCAVRYLGFCPDDLTSAPPAVVQYVAQQLRLDPALLLRYGQRDQTRTAQLQQVQHYLGYRDATPADLAALAAWLVERAQEHDKPTVLFQLAAEHLRGAKIVRPGITTLERLVASAREQAYKVTLQHLAPVLTPERRAWLDGLLHPDEALGRTRFDWLKGRATATTPKAVLAAVARITYLRAAGVAAWDLAALNPNRRHFLARLGQKMWSGTLARTPDYRRYPILVAFLHQTLEELIDEILDLFDRYLAEADRTARQKLDDFHRATARATNEKVILFEEVGELVLNPAIADADLRPAIHRQISPEYLRAAVDECKRLRRPRDDNYIDFLAECYPTLRQFTPALLTTLTFRANRSSNPVFAALQVVQQLNATRKRNVPDGAPLGFVPARWYPYLGTASGAISRRYYELCLLWELRTALRAGNIWVEGSRRYADPESYLIPPAEWAHRREEISRLLDAPTAGAQRLHDHAQTLTQRLAAFAAALDRQEPVRLESGELVIAPLHAAAVPASQQWLEAEVAARLPRLELADLLVEVDGWTHFSDHFTHAAGSEPRTPTVQARLYAVLLAGACNLSWQAMEHITEFAPPDLAWCANWYLRDDTLRPAIVALVNHQHRQPLSQAWGGGTLSSSDGQRFPVSVPSRQARPLPRYFAYREEGVTFYTWTSDQWPQYGTKVTPVTARDAPYVLDEILDNETELRISEHTTDTSGYTEMVFGMFALLGLQFAPRIRDLPDQRLYRLPGLELPPVGAPLCKDTINTSLILEHWDELLRLAGSLKLGWVTASLLLNKLQTVPRKNELARALQEYGRVVKTLFILRYVVSPEEQHRIERQLNKGELLHALRRFLFFGNWGRLRKAQEEEQTTQAQALTLVTNAVIVWNTVYMAAVLDELRAEGYTVREEDVAHLSPARHEHINPHGKYRFNLEQELGRQGLRPLRRPSPAKRQTNPPAHSH
jgi:TnpA family transposase